MIQFIADMFRPKIKLEIYMKSGNMLCINRVSEYKFKTGVHGVSELSLTQVGHGRKLLVSTINLDQIEAIVQVR